MSVAATAQRLVPRRAAADGVRRRTDRAPAALLRRGLRSPLAREIAGWARDYGNGEIDLSSRGNLQLRGVSEATLPALTATARRSGPARRRRRRRRRCATSWSRPLAGLDPRRLRHPPVRRALEARAFDAIARSGRCQPSSASRFDAGAFPLGDESADLMFEAVRATDASRCGSAATAGDGARRPFPAATCAVAARRGVARALACAERAFLGRNAPAPACATLVRPLPALAPFAAARRLLRASEASGAGAPAAPRAALRRRRTPLGAGAFVGVGVAVRPHRRRRPPRARRSRRGARRRGAAADAVADDPRSAPSLAAADALAQAVARTDPRSRRPAARRRRLPRRARPVPARLGETRSLARDSRRCSPQATASRCTSRAAPRAARIPRAAPLVVVATAPATIS